MSQFASTDGPPHFDFRLAANADMGALEKVLADAFQNDPLTTWFVRHDARRPMAFKQLFRWYLKEAIPRGLCHACLNPPAGTALWMEESQWKVSLWRQLLLMPEIIGVVGLGALVSRMRGLDALQSRHPHVPHRYLAVLGTHPQYQGQGIGSRLLGDGLRHCDEIGRAAYLETANPRNLLFYERHGFRVTGEINIPYSGPMVWQMWREPSGTGMRCSTPDRA